MSKPNNTIIETTAISYLKLELNRCRMLKPNISENDKGVSWDGNVEVYSTEKFSKKTLRGVVPVQVKGTWYDNIPKTETIKFQVYVDDLKNYQHDGGTIFFVICCNESNHAIYYNSLLPYDLDSILKTAKLETKLITLYKLGNSDNEIYGLFSDFLYHKGKQAQRDSKMIEMFAEKKLDLSSRPLTLGYGGIPNNSEPEVIEYMLSHPAYIYTKPEGFDIDVVLSKMNIDKIGKTIPVPIIYEGEVLFDKFTEIYTREGKDAKKVKLGQNILLDSKNEKVSIEFSSNLDERVRDMKFILWCAQNNKGAEFVVTLSDDSLLTEKELKETVTFLENLQNALNMYNVKKTLDMSQIEEDDYRKIQAFIDSTLYKKEVPYSINGQPGMGLFEFANISLLVCCIAGESENMYFMQNIFSVDGIGIHYEIINRADKIWMSPYLEFKAERFAAIDNFDADAIKRSIVQFIPNNQYATLYNEQINKCALELIAAYDMCEKDEILELADELLDILLSLEQDNFLIAIYRINKLQIRIRRKASLTTKEMTEIMKYKLSFAENVLAFT